jgi:Domain of unknown function (DUF4252)
MKSFLLVGIVVSCVGVSVAGAQPANGRAIEAVAQGSAVESGDHATASPVPLEWTPPALEELTRQAAVKSSFTLDRNLLGIAAGMVPDDDEGERQAIRKLDGVSVHTMRFGDLGIPDEAEVDAVRAAYHLRGWKHLVTTNRSGGPVHNQTTDVWVVLDGVNVRGAVILAETPRSLTLVTVAGNLNPVDLLHLRGHFGIPRYDNDRLHDAP